jgi:hypothetical protein
MHLTPLASIVALTGLVAAAPSSTQTLHSRSRLAQFDNKSLKAGALINVYDDLYYTKFKAVVDGHIPPQPAVLDAIKPHSGQNDIAYGPLVYGKSTPGLPNITAQYEGSVIESFDLHSFWFGFMNGTIGEKKTHPVTEYGEISASCFDAAGKTIASRSYKAELGVGHMTEAKTDGYKGCRTVVFLTSANYQQSGATVLDDVRYTVYSRKAF